MQEQYWRMQMHPADPGSAVNHSIQCISRGYIGLDFKETVGDLTGVDRSELPGKQQKYMDFATPMKEGDFVLIVAHHFPLALVKVSGDYNHIKEHDENLGIWCTHFREIELLGYYADWKTNAHDWDKTTMTDTISKLGRDTGSGRLISEWRETYGW
ncbi:MAG: hypothetical protein OXU22_07895 [Gammaproteobacteria bacterium]|nr:hypothetical protein [Gammaproteobacteria bacterium]